MTGEPQKLNQKPIPTSPPTCPYENCLRNIVCIEQVELSEEEARSLYQQLDSDRDGALGAEDLLRGAPTVGGVLRDLHDDRSNALRAKHIVARLSRAKHK